MAIGGALFGGGGGDGDGDGRETVGADADLDLAGSGGPDDGECAAVEGHARRCAEGLLGTGVGRSEATQHAGSADLDGHEPVPVACEVAVAVLEGDGDVGEIGVV